MGRLYGYVRVSTNDQDNSVQNQIARIQELAAKEGLPLEHVYVDEDVTARIPLKDRAQGGILLERTRSRRCGQRQLCGPCLRISRPGVR
jgi:DNA invertase Pin-like site-specific DNA recombinase